MTRALLALGDTKSPRPADAGGAQSDVRAHVAAAATQRPSGLPTPWPSSCTGALRAGVALEFIGHGVACFQRNLPFLFPYREIYKREDKCVQSNM